MQAVSDAEHKKDAQPYYGSWQVHKRIGDLVRIAKATSWWPEDPIGCAAYVALWDKTKISAVCAHGVVVAEAEIHLRRNGDPIFLDEMMSERSVSFNRGASIFKRHIGILPAMVRELLVFAL